VARPGSVITIAFTLTALFPGDHERSACSRLSSTLKDDPRDADGWVVGRFTTGVSGDLIIRPIIEKASNAP
jgi:hypothetical protein